MCEQLLCRALAEMGVAYDERFLHDMRSAIILRGPHKIAILPEGSVNYSSSWPKVQNLQVTRPGNAI